jgi:hypothetical protein
MDSNPFDLSREQVELAQREELAKRARQDDENETKWLMGSEQGRAYVWRLLERAGIFASSFNSDALVMALLEGRKVEGLRHLELINELCPNQYFVMVSEANARRIANDRNGDRADGDDANR